MRNSSNSMGERTQELLDRAAAFRALALSFCYPDPGHKAKVVQALNRIRPSVTGDGAGRALAKAQSAWRRCAEETLRDEYQRLFLGSGPVSLHETAYGDGRRIAGRPTELADISGFYTAFGLALSDTDPDLPDHLCSELEFYSLLLVKQAYTSRKGWSPGLDVTRRAARVFLEQHLGRWTRAFVNALRECGAASPYRETAAFLDIALGGEIRNGKLRPILATGRLPHDQLQDEEFICPRAAASA